MLSTQRVNSIFQERVSFSTTSRAPNTPPPTGPLIPPPAAPGAVKVKVSSYLSRIDILTNLQVPFRQRWRKRVQGFGRFTLFVILAGTGAFIYGE
jgi:hypothetical protein